jgi:hypothetical protein
VGQSCPEEYQPRQTEEDELGELLIV